MGGDFGDILCKVHQSQRFRVCNCRRVFIKATARRSTSWGTESATSAAAAAAAALTTITASPAPTRRPRWTTPARSRCAEGGIKFFL